MNRLVKFLGVFLLTIQIQSLWADSYGLPVDYSMEYYNEFQILHGITIQHFTANEFEPLPQIRDLEYLDIPSGIYIVVTRNAAGEIIESKKLFIR